MHTRIDVGLPIHDWLEDSIANMQKCYIPTELFPSARFKGYPAVCTIQDSQKKVICRLFSLDNRFPKDYALVDDSVTMSSSPGDPRDRVASQLDLLERVEVINLENLHAFDELFVTIKFSEAHVCKGILDDFILEEIVHSLLMPFVFSTNCIINLSHLKDKNFGIKELIIRNASAKNQKCFIGTCNSSSKIRIEKKVYQCRALAYKELGGIQRILANLENMFRANDLYWRGESKIKPICQTLIVGPSGIGKSTVIHNLVHKYRCNFYELRPADIWGQYPGDAEISLQQFFKEEREFRLSGKTNLSVILIEDIDLICSNDQTTETQSHIQRTSLQLMNLLDKMSKEAGCLLFATTANIEMLDMAVRRAGRMDQEVFIPIPNDTERAEILDICMRNFGIVASPDFSPILSGIARRMGGFVGADIALLVRTVANRFCDAQDKCESLLQQCFHEVLRTFRPTVLRSNIHHVDTSKFSLKNLAGMHDLKRTINISVLMPLKTPEILDRFDLKRPKGILLYGPPGCAKTTIAKCIAGETNMSLLSVSGAEIYSPYIGNSEKFISKVFHQARLMAPCIIFIDEIDAIVGNRSGSKENDVHTRVLSVLLTEMDGVGVKVQTAINQHSLNNILVIAATNRPDMIDDALLRPGRFDRLIHIPAPDRQSRLEILQLIANRMPFSEDIDLEAIASQTERFSGVDLHNLCNEAALNAMHCDKDVTEITKKDFGTVFATVRPSLTAQQIQWFNDFEQKKPTTKPLHGKDCA